jgi:hypothetical protein
LEKQFDVQTTARLHLGIPCFVLFWSVSFSFLSFFSFCMFYGEYGLGAMTATQFLRALPKFYFFQLPNATIIAFLVSSALSLVIVEAVGLFKFLFHLG